MSSARLKKASYLWILRTLSFLVASLLFHLSLVLGLSHLPSGGVDKNWWEKRKLTEIEVLWKKEKSRREKNSYVEDPEVDDKLLSRLTEKVDRLSKKARRVREETVARLSGPSQNVLKPSEASRTSKASPARPLSVEDLKEWFRPRELSFKDGLLVPRAGQDKKEPQKENNLAIDLNSLNSPLSRSSISTYHPGIKSADITALDTDKGSLQYYTFHLRLRDQLRPRWIQAIREIVNSIPQSTLRRMSRTPRVTTLEVVLDEDGHYVGSMIISGSNERLLDMAAKEAFEEAAPFVNPPEDMVEEDGYIYLPFRFRVELGARRFARSR